MGLHSGLSYVLAGCCLIVAVLFEPANGATISKTLEATVDMKAPAADVIKTYNGPDLHGCSVSSFIRLEFCIDLYIAMFLTFLSPCFYLNYIRLKGPIPRPPIFDPFQTYCLQRAGCVGFNYKSASAGVPSVCELASTGDNIAAATGYRYWAHQ